MNIDDGSDATSQYSGVNLPIVPDISSPSLTQLLSPYNLEITPIKQLYPNLNEEKVYLLQTVAKHLNIKETRLPTSTSSWSSKY